MSEGRQWRMHAGRDWHNGGYKNIGHPHYVEAHGHAEVVPVLVAEDPDGPYYGWLGAAQPHRPADTEPRMIQQREALFSMQFTYGPEVEVEAGKGRIVRLTITEVEP